MSTDRELLELAAKAAGQEVWTDIDGQLYTGHPERQWSPLTDDGDALRLAVKLNLRIEVNFGGEDHFASAGVENPDYCPYEPYGSDTKWIGDSEDGDDPCQATRRAIVRAAAEIGRLQ